MNKALNGHLTSPSGSPPAPRSPLGRFYLILWIIVAFHMADLVRIDPDTNMTGYLAEGGPFQNLQLVVLGGTVLVCIRGIRRHEGLLRGAWVILSGPFFYLFWREADFDKDYLSAWLGFGGIRMFSWRYLTLGEVPLQLKLVLGTISLALTATWLGLCWRFRASLTVLRDLIFTRQAGFWLAMGVIWLAIPQSLDWGWVLPDLRERVSDPYLEESPELLGELALLFLALTLAESTVGMATPAPTDVATHSNRRRSLRPNAPEREAASSHRHTRRFASLRRTAPAPNRVRHAVDVPFRARPSAFHTVFPPPTGSSRTPDHPPSDPAANRDRHVFSRSSANCSSSSCLRNSPNSAERSDRKPSFWSVRSLPQSALSAAS